MQFINGNRVFNINFAEKNALGYFRCVESDGLTTASTYFPLSVIFGFAEPQPSLDIKDYRTDGVIFFDNNLNVEFKVSYELADSIKHFVQ